MKKTEEGYYKLSTLVDEIVKNIDSKTEGDKVRDERTIKSRVINVIELMKDDFRIDIDYKKVNKKNYIFSKYTFEFLYVVVSRLTLNDSMYYNLINKKLQGDDVDVFKFIEEIKEELYTLIGKDTSEKDVKVYEEIVKFLSDYTSYDKYSKTELVFEELGNLLSLSSKSNKTINDIVHDMLIDGMIELYTKVCDYIISIENKDNSEVFKELLDYKKSIDELNLEPLIKNSDLAFSVSYMSVFEILELVKEDLLKLANSRDSLRERLNAVYFMIELCKLDEGGIFTTDSSNSMLQLAKFAQNNLLDRALGDKVMTEKIKSYSITKEEINELLSKAY